MNDVIADLRNLLLKGKPILFTGSGFSKFAKQKNGKNIPDGNNLKEELLVNLLKMSNKSNEFKELLNSQLSDVCDYCIQEKTESHLIDFLTELYSDCKPADFHKLFSNYNWKKIYSTNIDDVLENSFDKNKLQVQNIDRPKLTDSLGKIEYIKLHGCVRNTSGKFIFGSRDYIDSMLKSRDYRFNQFATDIQFGDFIFIGTDYNEVNLDYYLKLYEYNNTTSSKGKVFFINPKPNIVFKTRINKIGGKIIEWTTEEFANFLETEIINDVSRISANKYIEGYIQYNAIIQDFPKKVNYRSNLYLGYEPTWLDIYNDWDFINENVLDDFSSFKEYLEQRKINKSIYCLIGKSLVGKSVYLKRIGHLLYKDGYEVLEFGGRRFDSFVFTKFVKESTNNKFCLIIDNASYYYGAISSMLRYFPTSTEIIILLSSRPFFHSRKRYNLITQDFYEHTIQPEINEDLATQIEEKLSSKGFLGELRKFDKSERIQHIKKGNDISSVLFRITYGKAFLKRYQESLSKTYVHLTAGKEILTILSIFQILDLSYLPVELIALIYQASSKNAIKEIEDFIKFNDFNGVELRNLFLAKTILNKVSNTQIVNAIKDILVTISPQVTDEIHSYWNEIQATLMKEKLLRKRLNLRTKEIKNLLFEIQSYYNDNYNYWLQVGIAEQIENEYDKALNHFRQAETIGSNSYMVKNAIARNFLKQANYQNEILAARPYFDEGEKLMLDLIKNREEFQVRAFSTHCYIYEKVNYFRKFKLSPTNQELKDLFNLLNEIIEKAPEDGMARHISNHFFKYLKETNKTSIIDIKFHDLSKLKSLFEQYHIDLESIFEDFELE